MSLLQLCNLEKSYPLATGRSWVLRNINMEIAEGAFVSVMGPSGAGKSSLVHAGLIPRLQQHKFDV